MSIMYSSKDYVTISVKTIAVFISLESSLLSLLDESSSDCETKLVADDNCSWTDVSDAPVVGKFLQL